jgi:hypothetical protein
MTKRAKLTNPIVEAFKGGGLYTSGKRAGQPKEYDVIWDTGCRGLGVRYSQKTGSRTYSSSAGRGFLRIGPLR